MAYKGLPVRRGEATPQMAACRRNPIVSRRGWAHPRRMAASLVVAVLLLISTSSSSFLALLVSGPSAGYARCRGGL